ncbi:MAG: WS/DGAT domain-containing protein, partial [Thermoleophilaceae bacterium]
VPGPQFPLYLMGREMREIVPMAFLPDNHALAIAAMSYNGKLDFGLLGDYDAMPDIEDLAGLVAESLAELVDAAASSQAGPPPQGRAKPPGQVKPQPQGRAHTLGRVKPKPQGRAKPKPRAKPAKGASRAKSAAAKKS